MGKNLQLPRIGSRVTYRVTPNLSSIYPRFLASILRIVGCIKFDNAQKRAKACNSVQKQRCYFPTKRKKRRSEQGRASGELRGLCGGPDRGERTRAAKEDARRYSQERKPATEVTPPRGRAPRRRVASPVGSACHEKQQDFMVLHRRVYARAAVASAQGRPKANQTRRGALEKSA